VAGVTLKRVSPRAVLRPVFPSFLLRFFFLCVCVFCCLYADDFRPVVSILAVGS